MSLFLHERRNEVILTRRGVKRVYREHPIVNKRVWKGKEWQALEEELPGLDSNQE
ncbi:MAG TPA: hypothetical protein VE999_05295 [Gemmataceae bacterium]|nr:hypothetical protein [Gemmataceae bacterium]